MERIVLNNNSIDFVVLPQIELLSVIQILAGENQSEYSDWYANNEYYISKIKDYFKDFINHPAVTEYKKYSFKNAQICHYNFDNQLFRLDQVDEKDIGIDYLKLLNDFIIKSNYANFFDNMGKYYKDVLEYNSNKVKSLNLVENLRDYYKKNIALEVIFKMIQGDFGEYIKNNGLKYTILCGIIEMNKKPVFINPKQLSSLCFHECTHPFVNQHLTSDYDLLAKTEKLFIDVDENSIAKQNYFTYNEYLEDLVVRTVVAYMHFKYGYSTLEEYHKELDYMEEIGFIYIKDIASILETKDFYKSMDLIRKYLYTVTNSKKVNHKNK